MSRPEGPVLTATDLPVGRKRQGKVRDCYQLNGRILMVTTDRISAFDCVFAEGVLYKGVVLSELSRFWFERTASLIPNHLLSTRVEEIVTELPELRGQEELLEGRTWLVRRVEPIPVECVVRGYLAGSAYAEYRQAGTLAGKRLPAGLRWGEALPEPLFTPATKAAEGHDQNISFAEMARRIGQELARHLKALSLRLYELGRTEALRRGVIIADTKFEFGLGSGKGPEDVLLIDELFTPDSSRFWRIQDYRVGQRLESFDKQPLRDYLEDLVRAGKWDKNPPAPPLPEWLARTLSQRYLEAYRMLTGRELLTAPSRVER